MRRILVGLLCVGVAFGAPEQMRNDTATHKVLKSSTSGIAPADFDFSNVTVIGLPGGGGGGGNPGGANTQLQFNSSAAFGGVPYATYDGTTVQFRSGPRFTFADLVDATKKVQINLGAFTTGTLRNISPAPGADSVTVIPAPVSGNNFVAGLSSDGTLIVAQPSFANLGGILTLAQTSMSTNKLIGRGTSGTGPMEEITLGTNLTLSGTTLNATGGGGTPGGSATQLQFNNTGVFGGISAWTWDGTRVTALSDALQVADSVDSTKKIKFTLSALTTGTSRNVKIAPSADSTTVISNPATTNNFLTGLAGDGTLTKAQPAFSNLTGTIAIAQNFVPIGKEIFVDSVNGTNAGVRGDITKPFLAIGGPNGAINVALAGDIIYVGPGTFAQGTTPLVIPAGVTMIGAGVDYTIITSTLSSTSRAALEPGSAAAVYNLTVQNTSATGTPFGVRSASTAFASAFVSGCKFIGNSDGIAMNRTGSTALSVENTVVQTQQRCFDAQTAATATANFRACDFVSDGTPSTSSIGLNIGKGLITFRDGSITVGNSTGTNIAVLADSVDSNVQLHNVAISRNATGTTNFDLQQTNSAIIAIDNVARSDSAALSNSGTITNNIHVYPGNIYVSAASKLLGRGASGAGASQEITLGSGLTMTGTTLSSSGGGGVTDGDKGDITVSGSGATWTIDNGTVTYAKRQNVSASPRLLGRGTAGAGVEEEITLGTNLSMSGTTLNAAGGGGAAAGADTNIQFNDGGTAFGGDAQFTWDKTNNFLTVSTGGGGAGAIRTSDGSAATPSFAFALATDTGFRRAGTDDVRLSLSGVDNYMFQTTNGFWIKGGRIGLAGTTIAPSIAIAVDGNGIQINNGTTDNWRFIKVGTTDTAAALATTGLSVGHHLSSGTPAAGMASGIDFVLDDNGANNVIAGSFQVAWTDATDATHTSDGIVKLTNNGSGTVEAFRIKPRGTLALALQGSAPSSPAEGWLYANSVNHKLWYYDGTAFVDLTLGGAGGGVTSITGTSPVVVSPTTGATVASLNVGVDFGWTTSQSMSFSDALTNTVVDVLSLSRNSSSAGAAGLGSGLVLKGKSTTTNDQIMGEFAAAWVDPTHASRKSQVTIKPATASGLSTIPLRYYSSGYLTNGTNTDLGTATFNAGGGYIVNDVVPSVGKFLRSDGATYKDSAFTLPAPGANGDVMTVTAGVWTSAAAAGGSVSDTAFASSWDGVTTTAPSKNAVYDWGHTFDTNDNGKVNVLDLGATKFVKTDSGGVVSAGTVIHTVGATFDGGGTALATGSVGYRTVPYSGTITGYSISVDTGTCTVQTWKVADGTAVPTSGNSISTSGVALSTGTHVRSSTTSDFTTTTVTAGDIFAFNLSAVASATSVTFQLEITE